MTTPSDAVAFEFPIICFTSDGDMWAFDSPFELMSSGPVTLSEGTQIGMEMVEATGRSWRVVSVKRSGYVPFTWSRIFRPRLFKVVHQLEPGPILSLAEVQARVCASFDAFPDYWRDDTTDEGAIPARKAELLAVKSIADIHSIVGFDYFAE
jgi:hypothetical protein